MPTGGQDVWPALVSDRVIGLELFPKICMGNYYSVGSKEQEKVECQISKSILSTVNFRGSNGTYQVSHTVYSI